ncbi:hypothetical protein HDU79_005427 [Rhizoclosmatium sp. JEL0117]|nr:hypothetical protein HDU79_005427 [Rhizoclosmatium sp. JEL0117]
MDPDALSLKLIHLQSDIAHQKAKVNDYESALESATGKDIPKFQSLLKSAVAELRSLRQLEDRLGEKEVVLLRGRFREGSNDCVSADDEEREWLPHTDTTLINQLPQSWTTAIGIAYIFLLPFLLYLIAPTIYDISDYCGPSTTWNECPDLVTTSALLVFDSFCAIVPLTGYGNNITFNHGFTFINFFIVVYSLVLVDFIFGSYVCQTTLIGGEILLVWVHQALSKVRKVKEA